MPDGISVKLQGMGDIGKALQTVKASASKAALDRATLSGAEAVREEIANRAPIRTGALSRSIVVDKVETKPDIVTKSIGPSRQGFYARWVEFGTRRRRRGGVMPARPFIGPGFMAAEAEAIRRIGASLWESIRRFKR